MKRMLLLVTGLCALAPLPATAGTDSEVCDAVYEPIYYYAETLRDQIKAIEDMDLVKRAELFKAPEREAMDSFVAASKSYLEELRSFHQAAKGLAAVLDNCRF